MVRRRSQLREPPPKPPQLRREIQFTEPTSPARREGRFADRTRERHADVHRPLDHGHGLRAIGRQLGLSRTTVRRFANAAAAIELLAGRWAGLPSILDLHKPYLHQRVQDGCSAGSALFAELQGRGYRGGVTIVRRYVRQLRDQLPPAVPPHRPPSVRDVTAWMTRHPDSLSQDESGRLKDIRTRCPQLERATEHVRSFAEIMNHRTSHQLADWIRDVQADDVPEPHTFAAGLGQDLAAVTAGLTLPYTSGSVEGHNNRIKMLKRQMSGRAAFDLLRKRVLPAA